MTNYLTAKEIWAQLGITKLTLKYYRQKGYLKNVFWSPGKGRPKYDLEEVKKVFGK